MTAPCEEVLFVDDDDDLRAAHVQGLELAGMRVRAFPSAKSALAAVSEDFAGAMVTDVRMPDMDGLELFQRVRAIDVDLPVILITGHGDITMAVEALQQGAYDFVAKPFPMERLIGALRRARAGDCPGPASASPERASRPRSTAPWGTAWPRNRRRPAAEPPRPW